MNIYALNLYIINIYMLKLYINPIPGIPVDDRPSNVKMKFKKNTCEL